MPYNPTSCHLYLSNLLVTSENQTHSDVFKGSKKRSVARNWLV